jgi:O-antigen ligase
VLVMVSVTGPRRLSRAVRLSLWLAPVLAGLLLSPMGPKIIDLLPFIGEVESFNVTYRQRLFDVSLVVIRSNPWFGSFDYLNNVAMEEMVQGEGIIDIVNSFIGVALAYGLVGLGLFVGVFTCAGWSVVRVIRSTSTESELHDVARALLIALVGIVVTITTVSSIGVIPLVYWITCGLCVGCLSLAQQQATQAQRSPVPPSGRSHLARGAQRT